MGARKPVHEAKDIAPALRRALEVINHNDGAPVTKNETMCK